MFGGGSGARAPARFIAPLGVGVLFALAASHGAAQEPLPPRGMRSTLDDSDPAARLRAARQPVKKSTTDPASPASRFGTMVGPSAGKTGFVSTNVRSKSRSKTKGKRAAAASGLAPDLPPPLALTPTLATGPTAASEKAVAAASGPARDAAKDAKTTAKPATPPKPPALAARAEARGQLNTLPNTVVAVPRRPPEDDPFAPVGLRTGAFVLRPAIETAAGYDSNPGYVPHGKGSAFITVAPELGIRSDWQRHEFVGAFRGSYTWFNNMPELDRPNVDAKVAGRVDVTEDTRALLEGRYLLTAANPARPDLPADLSSLPIYTDAGASAGFAQRLNRLELVARGSFDHIEWDDAKLKDGTTLSNKDRDYNQYGAQARLSYELTPGVKPFVDVAADTRVYDLSLQEGGLGRDSDGIAGKVGSSFEITRTLTGEASIGYLTRTYKDANLPEMRGVLVDAALIWAATGLTTVRFNAVTTPQETTLIGVSGVLSYDTSVQVDHAFRRWLIGSARLAYGFDDYVGSPRQDQRYGASAALSYKLTRTVQVKGEVRQEWRRSNVPGNDYDATIGLVGLRWQP